MNLGGIWADIAKNKKPRGTPSPGLNLSLEDFLLARWTLNEWSLFRMLLRKSKAILKPSSRGK